MSLSIKKQSFTKHYRTRVQTRKRKYVSVSKLLLFQTQLYVAIASSILLPFKMVNINATVALHDAQGFPVKWRNHMFKVKLKCASLTPYLCEKGGSWFCGGSFGILGGSKTRSHHHICSLLRYFPSSRDYSATLQPTDSPTSRTQLARSLALSERWIKYY